MGQRGLDVTASLSGRRWIWREAEERLGLGIAERLGVPEIIGRVLAARGIAIEVAADFLQPTLRAMLPDPSCLADMDVAAERLAVAVLRGETIAVFGDYDVDGTAASALLVSLLRTLGVPVLPYIPDRLTEGYGPNAAALCGLAERGASLIVCVDCGSSAGAAFAAIESPAEVIVLDHHKIDALPRVLAIVNPSRADDRSNLGQCAATAITFLTAVALLRALRKRNFFSTRAEPDLRACLDLVALATICDAMPLTGLNRAFVVQGLKVMARRERPGVAALLAVAAVEGGPSAQACAFALGPRINAAGRIAEADLGLRLLLATDEQAAVPLAAALDRVNRERQRLEAEVLERALVLAKVQVEAGVPVLVVSGEGWHPGVVGIVAGRLKDRFNRPACVLGVDGSGLAKGSGRSVAGVDLGLAVLAARAAGILTRGGGHAMAAGFALPANDLPRFHAFLNEHLAAARLLPRAADLTLEGALSVVGATPGLASVLQRLAPFGMGNAEPMLVLPRVRVVRADRVGRERGSIRAIIQGEDGGRIKAMAFRVADGPLGPALLERTGRTLHLVGHLRPDTWGGREQARFIIADAALG